MFKTVLIFLIVNFAGLALGSIYTSSGVSSQWYSDLNQAPWTPPGWVFGTAWTTIMICFAVYMAYVWKTSTEKKTIIFLFVMQWILNAIWNPIFFHFHQVLVGLITIVSLTVLIGYFLIRYYKNLTSKSVLILPYLLWLIIATSLNAFILLNN